MPVGADRSRRSSRARRNICVEARAACALPALRKDFIIDEYQVVESRALGADAILLIVAALDDARLADARSLRAAPSAWTCWSKCTTPRELERALKLATPLIGINNRNLRTFDVSLHTTLELLPRIPADRLVVTESGILAQRDVAQMRRHGVQRVPGRRGVHARARSRRAALDRAVRARPCSRRSSRAILDVGHRSPKT